MNPDQPSREQIEARITALLLGELPAEEAALLRYTIAQDPALQKLHDQLQSALPLVREAAKHPADAPAEKPAPLKLSADRREKLLAHFKTPRPETPKEPLFWLKRIEVQRLTIVLLTVAIIAGLAVLFSSSTASFRARVSTTSDLATARMAEDSALTQIEAKKNKETLQNLSTAPQPNGPVLLTKSSAAPTTDLQFRTWSADNESREAMKANADKTVAAGHNLSSDAYMAMTNLGPADSPQIVTLAPEPQFAPPPPALVPPTQIVLPSTNTESEYISEVVPIRNANVDDVAKALKALGGTTVSIGNSQGSSQIGGLATSGGGMGGIGGSGGVAIGGGGGFGGTTHADGVSISGYSNGTLAGTDKNRLLETTNSANLAWDDSGVNRSAGENLSFGLQPAPGAMPKESFPVIQSPKTETQALADRRYYRKAARQPEETENKSLPAVATAEPAFQNSTLASAPPPAQMPAPAKPNAPVVADTFSANLTPVTVTPQHGLDGVDLASSAAGDTSKTSPTTGEASWAGTLNNPDAPHDPNNHFVTRYAYAGKTPTSLDQAQSTNYMAINSGGNYTFNPGVSAAAPVVTYSLTPQDKLGVTASDHETLSVNAATAPTPALDTTTAAAAVVLQKDEDGVKKDEPYEAAKADLDQKRKMHQLLYSKLEAEKLDLGIPNSSMVQLTDPAEPGKSQNMWQRLTGQVESTARIKIENDVIDIPSLSAAPAVASSGYDPYFIQTTFEIMQSEPVLGKVVDALDLQSTWAKNNGGEKLNRNQAIELLKQRLDLQLVKNTKLISISAKSDDPQEAANIANAVAKAYTEYRVESRQALTTNGVAVLEDRFTKQTEDIRAAQTKVERLGKELTSEQSDLPIRKPAPNTPLSQPEILTSSNAFSTFSLNVSDVSFKLAEASLENGKLPDTASIRSEEFINAFDYRDPEAAPGQPMAFTSERAAYPFAHNRDLLRFSIKTAAAGRQEGRPLNLVLLLDTSGSMERADRVQIIHEALRVLATQLHENDIVSVVSFARTARLWADGVSGNKAGETLDKVGSITPEGGTNLEEAMRLAYETARRHYLANGMNRVVLLTDGAANLGNVDPGALKQKVETQRKQGIALDCFGIGWEDLNDDLLEELSSNGDGRYAFLNSPEDAAKDFGTKLAGALQVAAQDVKVQVEFNPQRVISYRQIGYAKHQLTKQQFRDNTVAAGEIASQEAGNALYTVETNPNGDGPIATVHVRYRIPGTQDYHEHSWDVAYTGNAPALDLSSPAMRLAATASAFSEWLAASPYAQEVTPDALAKYLSGVPEVYGADDRPKQLETMIREAKSLEGK